MRNSEWNDEGMQRFANAILTIFARDIKTALRNSRSDVEIVAMSGARELKLLKKQIKNHIAFIYLKIDPDWFYKEVINNYDKKRNRKRNKKVGSKTEKKLSRNDQECAVIKRKKSCC